MRVAFVLDSGDPLPRVSPGVAPIQHPVADRGPVALKKNAEQHTRRNTSGVSLAESREDQVGLVAFVHLYTRRR